MTSWTSDELTRLADADEMHIAGTRSDGSLRTPVIVWMVRLGDDLHTRSVNGPTRPGSAAPAPTIRATSAPMASNEM